MTGWGDVTAELDAWERAGRTATLWWRDDDAVAGTPALDRLLGTAAAARIPVALAVIPALAEPALAVALSETVTVLQHGYEHRNHAPPGEKKAELGPHRPLDAIATALDAGRQRLAGLFGTRFLSVIVPPWNRIASGLVPILAGCGYSGLSTYGPRGADATDLVQVNTHIDIVDWRGGRGFCGTERALALAVGHLAARRTGAADSGEATGLLTHHLAHDEACWEFAAAFAAATAAHPAARWLGAPDLFPGP